MADDNVSVLEQIARHVLAKLASLELVGVANPDGTPCVLTTARALRKNSPRHLQAYLYQVNSEDVEDAPTQTDEWVQPFAVVAYIMPLASDPSPIDQYNNAALATVHRAIMSDYTQGGLAVNTTVKPPVYFPQDEGEYAGVTVIFDVRYRNLIDDPFAPTAG